MLIKNDVLLDHLNKIIVSTNKNKYIVVYGSYQRLLIYYNIIKKHFYDITYATMILDTKMAIEIAINNYIVKIEFLIYDENMYKLRGRLHIDEFYVLEDFCTCIDYTIIQRMLLLDKGDHIHIIYRGV